MLKNNSLTRSNSKDNFTVVHGFSRALKYNCSQLHRQQRDMRQCVSNKNPHTEIHRKWIMILWNRLSLKGGVCFHQRRKRLTRKEIIAFSEKWQILCFCNNGYLPNVWEKYWGRGGGIRSCALVNVSKLKWVNWSCKRRNDIPNVEVVNWRGR